MQFFIGFLLIQGGPNWGQEVAGHFYPEKQEYRAGEPIFIVLEVKNVGSRVIVLDDLRCGSLTRFEVVGALRRSPPGVQSGSASSCASTIAPWSPGATVKRRFLLQGPFHLDSPGIYTIRGHHTVWVTGFGGTPIPGTRQEITTDFDLTLHGASQTGPPGQSDEVFQITIPPNIKPDRVYVSYLLTGPFGGYGLSGYAESEQHVSAIGTRVEGRKGAKHVYLINTTVEGKRADSLKALVYAPGCEFQKISVPSLSSSQRIIDFTCKPALTFRGRVQPLESLVNRKCEIQVDLMATFIMDFFGELDGALPIIRLARTGLETDGEFRAILPDFTRDPVSNSFGDQPATLQFTVVEKGEQTISYTLEPTDKKYGEFGREQLKSAYPEEVIFRLR